MSTNVKCPKCRKNSGSCTYLGDYGGSTKFTDVYSFSCSCGYSTQQDVNGGDVGQEEWPTNCPFCGKEYCDKKRGKKTK